MNEADPDDTDRLCLHPELRLRAWEQSAASMAAPAQSQAGFWLNWTDRLKAINTTGQTLPNVPKIGP